MIIIICIKTNFKESTGWTSDGVKLPDGGLKVLLNQEGFDNKATSEDFFQSPSNGQTLSERGNNVVILHDDQSNTQRATTIKRINYYPSGKVKLYGRGRTYSLKRLHDKNPSFFIIN